MPLRLLLIAPSALVTDHRPHGDGLVAFGFIRELGARGHEIHVAAGHVDLRAQPAPNVHVHPLAGSDTGPVRTRLRFMWELRRLHAQLSAGAPFDVIHQLTPAEVGVTLALGDVTTPLVLGPYVPDWEPGEDAATRQNPLARFMRHGLRAAQQLTATSVLLSNPAAEHKVAAPSRSGLKVRGLPLGVDAATWRPMRNGADADVLFLANLDTRKGIHVLLDAFSRLSSELPAARLLVAGEGPESASVHRRVERSPGLAHVELLGHLDRAGAVAAMQRCAVYCLPAFGDPNPLSVLEAMACGKPVVVTEAGGLRHVVSEEGGRKVAPGEAGALASALSDLLTDPDLRRRMGAHNRRVVEESYAWERVIDRLEELYAEAMDKPRSRRGRRSGRDV